MRLREKSVIACPVPVDFDGDGAAELVYRDECWLRIFDGRTGKVLAAANITSSTVIDEPAVADVDGDGHAEIVLSSDSLASSRCGKPEASTGVPWTGPTQGVYVLKDPDNCWSAARRIWNQHSYHVTNVNDDGTIPIPEKNSWDGHNGYRQQVGP